MTVDHRPFRRSWRPGPGPTGIREVVALVLYREPVPPEGCAYHSKTITLPITVCQDIEWSVCESGRAGGPTTIMPWNWSKP